MWLINFLLRLIKKRHFSRVTRKTALDPGDLVVGAGGVHLDGKVSLENETHRISYCDGGRISPFWR